MGPFSNYLFTSNIFCDETKHNEEQVPTPLLAASVGGLLLHAGVPFQLVAGGAVGPGAGEV